MHARLLHGAPAKQGPIRRGLEGVLGELRRTERLSRMQEGHVELLRAMADEIDRDASNAQLCRTYIQTLDRLVGDDAGGDDFEKLLAEITSRASVGNTATT